MEFNALTIKALDTARNQAKSGVPYWRARDIQKVLEYWTWENFENVIKKARIACEGSGYDADSQFRETTKMVLIGSGAETRVKDFFLTRYACYLIAMNGDSSKAAIATAQTYFAIQARKQEVLEQFTDQQRRIMLREKVSDANIELSSAAKRAGVQRFPIFQDAGYRGLYGMGLASIKNKKKIPAKEKLLDRAGETELAANWFRITQAKDKIVEDRIDKEETAITTHRLVGEEVRSTIKRLNGVMPEELPAEPSIKKLLKQKDAQLITEKKSD